MDRLKLIKQAALKSKAKKLNTTVEELEFQEAVARLDERKAAKKEEMKLHKKLTASVKKAGKDSPGSLDCFKEENMFYSLCFFFSRNDWGKVFVETVVQNVDISGTAGARFHGNNISKLLK